MMLVDSHCHLDYPDFAEEGIETVVARARESGVSHMMTICVELARFPQVLAVAEKFPFMFCTVGTHPHHAAEEMQFTADDIVKLTADEKVVGIGETGLDYYYNHSPKEEQRDIFTRHVNASLQTNLPLIIHTRDADEDTIRVLKDAGQGRAKGVMHCFTGSMELARASLDLGFYISFSGIITFKKSEALREVVKFVPLDRMLVETDAPYLAPLPYRGKRNEPSYVTHTARMVADLKGMPEDKIAAQTTDNYFNLFTKARR
jgi:TatD DNase family protein